MSGRVTHQDHSDLDRTGRRVHVTDHARLKYLERVDPTEDFPAAAVEQAYKQSEDDAPDDPALVLVVDQGAHVVAVITVYPADGRGSSGVVHA